MSKFRYFFIFTLCLMLLSLVSGESSPDYQFAVFPAIAAATIGAGVISGLGSIIGSSSANSTNKEIAAENREWQTEENALNRDWQSGENRLSEQWQEKMWNANNLYNSPSAQMARNLKAGYNPYLLGSNSPASSSLMAGTPAKGSPFMVGAPNMPNIQAVDYGAPFRGAMQGLLQAKGVDAESANQKSQALRNLIDSAREAYKVAGYRGYWNVIGNFAPFLLGTSPAEGYVEKFANEQYKGMLFDNAQKELTLSLGKKYSEQQIQTALEKTNYEVSEIVGRLNTMRIQNDATIKRLAFDALVAAAQAFKLRKEGDKFAADAKTVNAIRDYVVGIAQSNATLQGNAASLSSVGLSGEKALIPMRQGAEWNNLDVHGNKNLIFLDYVTDQIGDVFNVGLYHGTGSYTNSGKVQYGQMPFTEASWDAPNPFGGSTHYRQRK